MLSTAIRWQVAIYTATLLVAALAGWVYYPTACPTATVQCFKLYATGASMAIACVFLLLLYGWKFYAEAKLKKRHIMIKATERTPAVWVLLIGRAGIALAIGWLIGAGAKGLLSFAQ